MSHTPVLLRVIEQNELDKTSRCVRLVDSNGVFALAVDEKYGDRISALWNMAERLRLTTEEIDGRKIDNALYKLEELELMIERVERAEAVKESLTSALLKISGFSAFWKGFRDNEGAWENVWDIATDALNSLRTAEESSVVGLIDSTPTKQPEDSANADGDWDSVIDE